jgi:hypothetical protein
MAVKIQIGLPTYNKPPAPDKIPPKSIYPDPPMDMEGTQVWISIPQPDKLHISGRLLPEHFSDSYQPEDTLEYGPMIMHCLASGQAGKVLHSRMYKANTDDAYYGEVQLAIGQNNEPVFFKLGWYPKSKPPIRMLTIHANPRALGEEGVFELINRLHVVTQKRLRVGAFLASATISRLDVAVDVVGLAVPELMVSAVGEGKRVQFYAKGGELETVNVHLAHNLGKDGKPPAKQKKSPLNDLLVKIYDKRAERINQGFPPPFGPAPVTRIEVEKDRFGNKTFGLQSLKAWKNPLIGIRVGRIRSAVGKPPVKWLEYAEARRGGGPQRAASICGFDASAAKAYEKIYQSHGSDVLDVKKIWQGWVAGINSTGLNYLIEAAEQKSSGVPYPPEEMEN